MTNVPAASHAAPQPWANVPRVVPDPAPGSSTQTALAACVYCGSPIAWLPRSVGGVVPLDVEPVAVTAAHPDAPLYALRRDGAAVPVRDLHAPPAEGHLAHRCPQYRDALAAVDALAVGDELMAWAEAIPPVSRSHRRMRGTA